MAHDVFISYSTRNATVADTVCAGLERRGLRCWIAPRDITAGQTWAGAIVEAIDTCKVFVLIVSSASNCSDDVLQEVQNAASAGVPIIPFRIEDITLSHDMRYYLGTRIWLDALTQPLEQHIVRLATTVARLLGREPTAKAESAEVSKVEIKPPAAAQARIPTPAKVTEPSWTASGPDVAVLPQPVPDDAPWERPGSTAGEETVGPDGGTLVWVPGGSFMMGSEDGENDEKPVHQVELDGFWLGKTEVTVGEWRSVMGSVPGDSNNQGDNHPVVDVSWRECQEFCAKLGLELPTEAQWEYAARGSENRVYPWGDEWEPKNLCWFGSKGPGGRTFPVGSFPAGASWCGALDMAGNVFEWCADWYSATYYQVSPELNPPGPESGTYRVLRGGSWYSNHYYCRAADRPSYPPTYTGDRHGFRVSRSRL